MSRFPPIIAILLISFCLNVANGSFDTVINYPPGPSSGQYAQSNTQINVYDGGSIDDDFEFSSFDHPATNIEVNIYGGTIGRFFYAGNVWQGPSSNVVVNNFGGDVGTSFGIQTGGTVNWSGGTFGQSISTQSGSQLNISGADVRLDGTAIAGLSSIGSTASLNLPPTGVLSGTLSDGTPFAVSGTSAVEIADYIADGTLVLHTTAIPPAAPLALHSPGDPIPRGLRSGQSITLASGGVIGNNFTANWGSAVNVNGGQIADSFKAVGATVSISSGSVGDLGTAFMGATVNLTGGSIGSNFTAAKGSVVNVSGGTTGGLFEAQSGSVVNFSGGSLDDYFESLAGSQVTISGGEFRLNGIPVSGLAAGSSRAISVPAGNVLSGTFADGTPFVFSDQAYNYFADGTLTLRSQSLPAAGPNIIQVPSDPAPKGLRSGQSLVVSDGGIIGDNFTAGWGSAVTVNGGQIGRLFKAAGAMVNVNGGSMYSIDASYGTFANVAGGSVHAFFARRGSIVNVSGGSVDTFWSEAGSVVNVAGGAIGSGAMIEEGSVVNFSGGSVGRSLTMYGGTFNMSGGTVGEELSTYSTSIVNLSGGAIGHRFVAYGFVRIQASDFRLDGVPISGLDALLGADVPFDIPIGSILSGTLADGTPFALSSLDGDSIKPGSLRLQPWFPPPAEPALVQVPDAPAPLGVRSGQTLIVGPGGTLGDNFNAGWGSIVSITGGQVGANFEAVGSQVTVTGGTVGDSFEAFCGSTVNVFGGSAVGSLVADRGSILNVAGGRVAGEARANDGGIVNVSGGLLAAISAAAGSEIRLFGTSFRVNGTAIADLAPGQMREITDRNVQLSGFFADGSPFSFYLDSWNPDSYLFVDPNALLTVTSILYGDYNGNDIVDAADYSVWRDSLGQKGSGLAADGNGNGIVDAGDYDIWRSHFGDYSGMTAAATGSVPEPSSSALALLAAAALATPRIFRGNQ
ncbi:MAG TPA: hypothetical protein VGM76_16795 [Lacipirellulaceae bacterium]|jgi:hypothetical protein